MSLLISALAAVAFAQADTSFTYQGELKVDGAPAAGLFDLQACLYADAGSGAPLACAAPIEDLPIADGRFTVALDFGVLFDASPRWLGLAVREGGASTAHVPLLPRQALRPAPQAQFAARAPFGGLTGVPAGLADGDNAGVTQLVAGAGLSGGTITSTGTVAIAPGGVSAAMLAPNAVGAAQIDSAQVQARVAGTCAPGHYFRGIAADGAPQCELLPVSFERVIDSPLDNGKHVQLALRADQRPLLAYHEDDAGTLRLYDCADPVCSQGTARSLATSGDSGEGIALALRPDGRPALAYINASTNQLRFYSCNNAACTSGVDALLDGAASAGSVDMALRADGRAVVGYRATTGTMRTWHCADIDCSAGTSQLHGSLFPTGLAVVVRNDGRPLLAEGGNGGSADSAQIWDCANANCTSGTLRAVPASLYYAVRGLRVRPDGRPMLLIEAAGGDAKAVSCKDIDCTDSQVTSLTGCDAVTRSGLAMRADGGIVVACGKSAGGQQSVSFHECASINCTSGSARDVLPPGRGGDWVAVAVRSDERPVIAYRDAANGDVALYLCATPQCP